MSKFHRGRIGVLVVATVAALLVSTAGEVSASPDRVTRRSFTCHGSLGEPMTTMTVTGELTNLTHRPTGVTVTATATGAVLSSRALGATDLGASQLQAGYHVWGITGPPAGTNRYWLHIPPVLPGAGGFFDAQLEVLYNKGLDGGIQIPMTDCTVAGGPPSLVTAPSPRVITCHATAGEIITNKTITGTVNRYSRPLTVSVADHTGAVESQRTTRAGDLGASDVHPGYHAWNVTGPNPDHTTYRLHVPGVLPPVGGYFDADLELVYSDPAAGSVVVSAVDCTVTAP